MGWRTTAYRAVRPLLFAADPEIIHGLALRTLASSAGRALAPLASGVADPASGPIELMLMGLRFRNRVGLGAGFD